ncbi:MAG: hypothetical protein IJF16_06305 [Clostridia bacterium]|nr:hypothetical protein [Clostridia bacterium]
MKIIAHRNETPGRQEGSIESLEYSAKEGIFAVECDVRKTGDGKYVIFHDGDLMRLAGVDKSVGEITLDEMKEHLKKAGRAVLTLDELIKNYKKATPILLHIKMHTPYKDLIECLKEAKDMFIFGVESLEMLDALKTFAEKDRLLAFMPQKEMYGEFIDHGIGIIRLWEHWLCDVTIKQVHECGADEVWIMCNTKEHGMDGCPESLDMLKDLNADGALISDVEMAMGWLDGK